MTLYPEYTGTPNNGDTLVWDSAAGVWEPAAGGGGVSDGDKGDVIVSGGGTVWTVEGWISSMARKFLLMGG